MKIVGIDLAGNPKNDTGFCLLEVKDDEEERRKVVMTKLLHSNLEIIREVEKIKPKPPPLELIAIDAPLTYSGTNRKCDDLLKNYGTLPVTLKGMEVLAIRGIELAKELKKRDFEVIEVFSTASAKILGFYAKEEREMQKNLLKADLSGDVEKRFLTKDELDAIFAAITGYLYLKDSTDIVGDGNGKIVIPKV
jgi:hypothetical protein